MHTPTVILTALCEALDQNELMAFNEESKLMLLVQKLLECQAPFENDSPSAARKTDSLLKWFESNGGICKVAEVVEASPQSCGMKAVSMVTENDPIVRVPQNLLITADCANCPELHVICNNDSTLAHMPNLRLSLNLLNERLNPSSKWLEYFNALPKSYSSLLYLTSAHFQLLRPSPAFATCARLYCKLLGSYVYLHSKFFGQDADKPLASPSVHFTADNFTFAAFRWAVSTVMTRQNNVPIGGGLCLVPVLDMFNHDPHLKSSVDFDAETGQVIVYAPRSFAVGDELKIFYGVRTNHDLFVHNGFALFDNPADAFYLQIPFKMVDNDDERRKKLLSRLGLERDCFKLTLSQPLPRSLLACLHVEFAPDETVEKWLKKSVADALDEVVVEKPPTLDADVYRKAYVWLAAQIGFRLRGYKETDKSVELPEESNIASCNAAVATKNIQTLLQCEKKILEAVVARLQGLLQK